MDSKDFPRELKVTFGFNILDQLYAAWRFDYKGRPYGEVIAGLQKDTLHRVLDSASETFKRVIEAHED